MGRVSIARIGFVVILGVFAGFGAVTKATSASAQPMKRSPTGYWEAASDGGVFSFGDAPFYGSMGGAPLNRPIVGIVATPDGKGYWLFASDGGVFAFGDAQFFGSTANSSEQDIIGMATTPDGKGYWLVSNSGSRGMGHAAVYSFGDAQYYGTTTSTLSRSIVGIASTPDGKGYWLVASDGGVFSFGDASFYGSMGGQALNEPIVAIESDQVTGGYWLVGSDGGVFGFNAPFCFSLTDIASAPLQIPWTGIVGISAASDAYWLVSPNGAIWSVAACGTPYFGGMLGKPLNAPVVGMAAN